MRTDSNCPGGRPMNKLTVLLAAGMIAGASGLAFAQGGGSSGAAPGDAHPPGALKQGGIPPAAAMRRGDDMNPANTGGVANPGQTKKVKMTKAKKKKHSDM